MRKSRVEQFDAETIDFVVYREFHRSNILLKQMSLLLDLFDFA